MSSVLSQVGRWCRDQLVGPQLPTYDRACEELGGVPWRPKPEATDRWFIVETPARSRRGSPPPIPKSALLPPIPKSALLPPSLAKSALKPSNPRAVPQAMIPSAPQLPTLSSADSAAFVLKKSLSEGAKLTMLGSAATAVIVICLLSLVGGRPPAAPAAAIATAPPANAPVLLAAVTQTPTAGTASIVAKSSAPHSIAAAHAHAAAKRRVAARHRRR